jgi:hypothetical protein
MPNLDLTDEEHAALLRLVKRTLDSDRFPLSPRGSTRCGRPWPSWPPSIRPNSPPRAGIIAAEPAAKALTQIHAMNRSNPYARWGEG